MALESPIFASLDLLQLKSNFVELINSYRRLAIWSKFTRILGFKMASSDTHNRQNGKRKLKRVRVDPQSLAFLWLLRHFWGGYFLFFSRFLIRGFFFVALLFKVDLNVPVAPEGSDI